MLFLLLTNLLTGFILTAYSISSSKKEHTSKLVSSFLWVFFLPSVGYGLWDFRRRELAKERNIQVPAYYIFNKMGIVHALFIPAFFLVFLMDFWIFGDSGFADFLLGTFFLFVLSVIYFVFLLLGLLAFIMLPFFIANMVYKRNDSGGINTGILDMNEWDHAASIDMREWERAAPPADKKDLSYQIDDEYISLADDDDDEIIIDLD